MPPDERTFHAQSLIDFMTYRRDHARANQSEREREWPTPEQPMTDSENRAYWLGFFAGQNDAYVTVLHELGGK